MENRRRYETLAPTPPFRIARTCRNRVRPCLPATKETSVFSFQLLHDMHARLWTIVLFVVAQMLESISRSRGFTAMRKRYLSFLSLLVPAFFLLSGCAYVEAQEKSSSAGNGKRWSDPATWPDREGTRQRRRSHHWQRHERCPRCQSAGAAQFNDRRQTELRKQSDLELTTEWIMLHGELQIGSEANPHTRNATITLTNNVPGEDVMAMGDRGIMLMGGTLSLHGNRKDSWTKLAKTAAAGSNTIEVLNTGDWKKGDEIVVASTDFDPHQAERRTISSISGKVITLDQKLEYMHYGQVTFGVDERAEVGMLSRNIHIQASADAETSFSGGHVMAMAGSTMKVSGVEFFRMGQHENLARYPIHWHLVGDTQGQYIQNSAIHDTYSRCVTVHGTNNVRVENNVAYNNVGHCYFLEDGVEHGNQYLNNLGILTKCNTNRACNSTNAVVGIYGGGGQGQNATDQLLPSDNTASTFWITNPDNTYRGNVSAGSEATGFWMAFPEHPTGKFEGTEIAAKTWPRRMQFREFSGNVAHSNIEGLMLDRGPNAQGKFNLGGNYSSAPYGSRRHQQREAGGNVQRHYHLQEQGRCHLGPWRESCLRRPEDCRQRYRLHACVPWYGPVPRRLYFESHELPVRGRKRQ